MESLKKNIVWYLCAIVIVLGYMVHHEYNKGVQYQKQSDTLENTISALNQKVKVSEIKLADSITAKQAEVVSLEMTNKNLQSLYGQLLQASQTKSKDIQTLVVTKTITSGTDTVLCLVDSFCGLKAHWADPYINIQVDIDSAKRAAIDYSIKDSLTIINYQKKHSILFGLIKWKSYEGCKVITHNPKATPVTVLSNSVIGN
jgi:hypothetical protein